MNKILALGLLLSSPLFAQTVYKTVEDGVISFSDSPPEAGAAEVLTIDVPPPADDGVLEARLAEMRDTTDRMASDRREREKHRAEIRDIQQAAVAPAPTPQTTTGSMTTSWQGSYWPGYGRPVRPRPPIRPGNPGRPTPSPEPYSVPGWSVMKPGNSQLMRPILSSGR